MGDFIKAPVELRKAPAEARRAVNLAGGRRAPTAPTRRAGVGHTGNRFVRSLERMAAAARIDLRAIEIIGIGAAIGLFLAIVASLAANPALAILAFPIGLYLPVFWLGRRARTIQRRFHDQLGDTVSLLASAVRAGNALPRAFERVAAEAPEPTRGAFSTTVREIALGAPLEEALSRLGEGYPSEEMDLLVASVNVQYQVGGNLAKVLDLIADTFRERISLQGEVSSLTASQRYSAYLLSGMPVVVLLFLTLVSPDYVGVLFQERFRFILVGAGFSVLLGFFVMQQLAKVEV